MQMVQTILNETVFAYPRDQERIDRAIKMQLVVFGYLDVTTLLWLFTQVHFPLIALHQSP